MLQSNGLKGRISAKESITAKLNNKEVQIYPELEDLVVTPLAEEQHFKSEKYGYDNVTVKAIESEEIAIVPSAEKQVKEGMFNKVTVAGDSNLVPENIKDGTEIFGVTGIAKTTNIKITDASYLFYNGARFDIKDEILKFIENCINMNSMFRSCSGLTSLDLSRFDTSQVTDMNSMFYYCSGLTSLDLSRFDTSKVTNMNSMFYYCSGLTSLDLSGFDTSKVTDMNSMFYYCSGLTSLDLSGFDTSKVTNMNSMFRSCSRLTSLDLSNFDTSQVTGMYYMFSGCEKLTTLNLNNFDMSKANYISYMFYLCRQLTNLFFGFNLGKGYTQKSNNYSSYKLDLSYTTKLTHESLMSVINNLYDLNLTYDVANGGTLYTQSLVLGATNLAKLTAEEIAIATSKGWNVT